MRNANVWFFLAGVVTGGVVALLTAPKSGKEMRHLIKEDVCEARQKMRAMRDNAEEYAEEKLHEARQQNEQRGEAATAAHKA